MGIFSEAEGGTWDAIVATVGRKKEVDRPLRRVAAVLQAERDQRREG